MDPASVSGDLIRQAQTGDHRAFTALLTGADEKMRRLAFRLLGSRAAMDDALQDAYLKAYRKMGTYDGRAAFPTWLYTIVYRTCVDHLRVRDRRAEVDLEAAAEPVSSGSNHADRIVDADALDRALRDLPADQAAVVLLVDGEGCSYQEAAAILDVREGTIASRLNRAHQALHDALGIDSDQGGPS